MSRLALAMALAVIGCGDGEAKLRLVIDTPPEGSPAYPFAAGTIDELRLTVARAGDRVDLQTSRAAPGGELSLSEIPFGTGLVLHLYGELGGTEVAYGRSCAFDYEESGGPEEIHIYFSRAVRWGLGPPPVSPGRVGGHAFARPGGAVVLAGGETAAPLELFDPRLGRFEEIVEAPETLARAGARFAAVGEDRAVIVGGTAGDEPVATVETLPDLRDSLEDGPPLRGHAAAALVGRRALVAGGEIRAGDSYQITGRAWEFRLGEGNAIVAVETAPLASPRTDHSATRLSDETGAGVLIAGGTDGAGQPVTATEIYRPLAGTFELLPGLLSRWGHQAIRLPGGFVLIAGGLTSGAGGEPVPASELALFDPVQGVFAPAGELPPGAGITDFSATTLPDGRVLLAGGRDAGGALVAAAHIARLDPIDGRVDISVTDPLATPRARHVALLACDGTVLVTGGEVAGASPPPSERYNPTSDARR